MSQWTHVCGAIRYDDLRKAVVRPGFEELARERFTIPEPKPVHGSEGPLTTVWHHGANGFDGYGYMSTLLVFGDLRDFGRPELHQLKDWWRAAVTDLPAGVIVRNGILQVEIEGEEQSVVWQAVTPPELT